MNARQLAFVASRLFAIYNFVHMVFLVPYVINSLQLLDSTRSPSGRANAFAQLVYVEGPTIIETVVIAGSVVFFWYGAGLVSAMICRGIPQATTPEQPNAEILRAASAVAGWLIVSNAVYQFISPFNAILKGSEFNKLMLVAALTMFAVGMVLVVGQGRIWRGIENFYSAPTDDGPPSS